MELKPDARRVLALAQAARSPGAGDKARVERKLTAALATAAAGGATLTAGEALAHSATVAKPVASYSLHLWLAGVLLGGAITGGYLLQSAAPAAAPSPSARAAVETPATARPAPERAAPTAAPAPSTLQPARGHVVHARVSSMTAADDLNLLQRAQLAWREGDARRALALLTQHRRSFPASQLTLERDALRILALCQLGERSQARALAQALLARAPAAPMRATIEQSCALK